jgi:hypothetical protein
MGYDHKMVDHSKLEYVSKDKAATNDIESFWACLKRSIKGSHIWVSVKWLTNYLNEFTVRFNSRKSNFLEIILRLI